MTHHCHRHICAALLLAASLSILTIQAVFAQLPTLRLESVAENRFDSPVAIANAGDGLNRLFIVEQRGTVSILLESGEVLDTPFLDISSRLVAEREGFDERGLLSIAFHPDFATEGTAGQGKVYAYYSAGSPNAPGTDEDPVDHRSVVAEYSLSENVNRVDENSERILLTFDQPQFNHDGGQLVFGPEDKMLYISTGDGGGADDNDAGHTGGDSSRPSGVLGNALDLSKLLGKILRIDPFGSNGDGGQYGIPQDNPFVDREGARDEIWAYGLRNPWRMSFDDGPGGTNELYVADVGQRKVEEVNIVEKGMNYGWRLKEGREDFDTSIPQELLAGLDPAVPPVAEYAHPGIEIGLPQFGTSVTGGFVYRGTAIPELNGVYVFGDWTRSFQEPSGTLLVMTESEGGEHAIAMASVAGGNPLNGYIPAFGEDEAGELYVATKRTLGPSERDDTGQPTGSIFRIIADEAPPEPVTITLAPSQDNTLFEDSGTESNGSGRYLFSGKTESRNQGRLRRALLQFDVAGTVPAGATIVSAKMSLTMNKTIVRGKDFGAHRLLASWGEGSSDASGQEGRGTGAQENDATWTDRFLGGDKWAAEGGDFVGAASAVTEVNRNDTYEWTGDAFAQDVQFFLNEPAMNFGWILIGPENEVSAKTIPQP